MEIVAVDLIPKVDDITETPVSDLVELYKVANRMSAVCEENKGVGMSAVQVSIPWKFFIVRHEDGAFRFYVDCEYEPLVEEKNPSMEGCLSLRGSEGELRMFQVDRYKKVRVVGKELVAEDAPVLKEFDKEIEGFYGVVFQHEIDHHNGILISEIGSEKQIW